MEYPVQDFYKNAHVLITGGTGFMGKALIEKLLRTCSGIKKIYVIIRPKKGMSSEERCQELLKADVFDRIRRECPERLSKLKPVFGDVSLERLGLSPMDEEILVKCVNIVFHSAASVRFHEPLSYTVNLNVLGTKRLLDMCRTMTHLKSWIYISTAFCNTDKKRVIDEQVYPGEYSHETICELLETLPEKLFNALTPTFLGTYLNTYAFTKALSENLVAKYAEYLPVSIVRPSIVSPALEEPTPGWMDSFHGSGGVFMAIYRGSLKAIIGNYDTSADMIPADYSINLLIVAAWHHLTIRNQDIPVYNSVVGKLNRTTWGYTMTECARIGQILPTLKSTSYPSLRFTRCQYRFKLWILLGAIIPAYISDLIDRFNNKPPQAMKTALVLEKSIHAVKPFVLGEWQYRCTNVVNLFDKLAKTGDKANFRCDVRDIKWDKYMMNFVMGIRKHLLKDPIETMPKAKLRMQIFYIVGWIFWLIYFFIMYSLITLFI